MKPTHRVTQGDTFYLKVPLLVDGVPAPIAGWSLIMTVKRGADDSDADAIFQLRADNGGVTPYDATAWLVTGAPACTRSITPGRYFGDYQAKSPADEIFTLESIFFAIEAGVTASA